jgi:hypothetical protein
LRALRCKLGQRRKGADDPIDSNGRRMRAPDMTFPTARDLSISPIAGDASRPPGTEALGRGADG